MAKDDFLWWQRRLKHMAQYFSAYRIDHILGFFRIWEIPGDCTTGGGGGREGQSRRQGNAGEGGQGRGKVQGGKGQWRRRRRERSQGASSAAVMRWGSRNVEEEEECKGL